MLTLTKSDFDAIGQIASHCNWSQLKIAIQEAKDFDLVPLMCYGVWKSIEDSYDAWVLESDEDEDAVWEHLDIWEGGEFTACNKKPNWQIGLKRAWIYFAYARYVIESANKDTPTGRKVLDADFTIPVNIKDLRVIENKYRNMAIEAFGSSKNLLCVKGFSKDCEACRCDFGCSGRPKLISGVRSSIVYRKL